MLRNRVIEGPLHSWTKPKWDNLLIKLWVENNHNQENEINNLIIASFKMLKKIFLLALYLTADII